jgi:hypothetical protein
VIVTADEALAGAGGGPRPREEATDWLRERLAAGPVPANDIWKEAKAAGFAEATVKRAKRQLGVETFKAKGSLGGGWMWRFPGSEGDHEGDQNPEGDHPAGAREVIPFGTSDPLRRGSEREEDHRRALGGNGTLPQLEGDNRDDGTDAEDGAWTAKL